MGFNVLGGDELELQKANKNLSPQVPLSELEKAAGEFETRKRMLFGQNQKGTGLNPISITEGSPSPSDLKSSARGPETELEDANDNLDDTLFNFDDYADAALVVAETELDDGGSKVNRKVSPEENEGPFGLVNGGFQEGQSTEDIGKVGKEADNATEQDFVLVGLEEIHKRMEEGPDASARFEGTEGLNFISREEPITSDCGSLDAANNGGIGKLFDSEVEEASLEWPQINK